MAPRRQIVYCLLRLRRYEDALPVLKSLERDFPTYEALEATLALKSECQMALGDFEGSARSLERLLREYPNYALVPKAMLLLGM